MYLLICVFIYSGGWLTEFAECRLLCFNSEVLNRKRDYERQESLQTIADYYFNVEIKNL